MRILTPFTTLLIASLLVALGFVVCLAWILHIPVLMQILPNAVPMQFNTALLFLVSGAGLAGLRYERLYLTQVSAIVVGLFAAITLSQYITGANTGIDQLFLKAQLSPNISHPGRMAPNTALAFVIGSISLYLLSGPRNPFTAAVLATLVVAMGIVSVLGYAFGLTTAYGWGQLTRMAIHTSAAFVLLGCGLFITSALRMKAATLSDLPWTGAVAGILVASLSLLMWQAVSSEHVHQQHRLMEQEAQAIAERLAERAGNRLLAVERMAFRYVMGVYGTAAGWQEDAASYLRDMPAIDLILVEDANGQVLARHARNVAASRRMPPHQYRLAGSDTGSEIVRALDGPWLISTQRHAKGGLIRVYAHTDSGVLADSEMRRPNARGYQISIVKSDDAVLNADVAGEVAAEAEIPPPVKGFKVRVQHQPEVAGVYFRMPDLLLVSGLGIALLLSLAISQSQKLKQTHHEISQANAALLARSQSLAASNESLEQFAYAASHDLKSPIRTMVSFTQLIGMQEEGATVESVKDLLQEVVNAGKGLNDLVDTLLEVSRAGRIAPEAIKSVPMRSVVDTVIARLGATIKEREVEIEIGELPEIQTEPNLMAQVLQNLISNAIKFQASGRPYVGVFAVPADGGWQFSVVDHGPGIESKYQEEIFKLFRRGKPGNVEGTGVGLAIVRRIVNGLGGRVWVESVPGNDTTFRFFLPHKPMLLTV